MRRAFMIGLALAAGLLVTAAGDARRGQAKEKGITVTGTLIDTKCYSMNPANKGNDHATPMGVMKGCGALCARLGIPVAVLTARDDVWILVTPAQDLAEYVGQAARVTGAAVYGGTSVRPDQIEVKAGDGRWTTVAITMPMPTG